MQQALKDTVISLLKQLIRERYPHKGEPELKHLFEEITSDKVSLESLYWTKVVERMYDSEDSELLQSKIKEKVSHHSSSNTNMQARGSLDRSGSKASKTGSNLQNA